MTRTARTSLALIAACGLTLMRLASASAGDTSAPTPAANATPESITGKISAVDTKTGTFDVRSSDGKIVHLKDSQQASSIRLRRGERVVVTYADGVALKVQATRNEKAP